MGAYQIIGGTPITGVVHIHGAKNSVLPILAATLANSGRYILSNCPDISDVRAAIRILRSLGCNVERYGDTIEVDSRTADRTEIPAELMCAMRAAIIFLGALIKRFGHATICKPGGCVLGERPIDLHLLGLRQMGVRTETQGERLHCSTKRLHGCTVALPFPSVGATENLILAALGCEGEVIICNAAKEPEIGDLIAFLRSCGAEITGDGGSVLRITGNRKMHGTRYRIMPDRMEAVTYLCAAAITGGELCLKDVCPKHFSAVSEIIRRSGCRIEEAKSEIKLRSGRLHSVSPIITAPYPEFPTDAQAVLMSLMCIADGTSVFEETVFSDRFRHVPALCAMGASVQTTAHYAIVKGVKRLHGAKVSATDLRGGAAMVLAALSADGISQITDTEHIERGYASFVPTLQNCGAQIKYTEG